MSFISLITKAGAPPLPCRQPGHLRYYKTRGFPSPGHPEFGFFWTFALNVLSQRTYQTTTIGTESQDVPNPTQGCSADQPKNKKPSCPAAGNPAILFVTRPVAFRPPVTRSLAFSQTIPNSSMFRQKARVILGGRNWV